MFRASHRALVSLGKIDGTALKPKTIIHRVNGERQALIKCRVWAGIDFCCAADDLNVFPSRKIPGLFASSPMTSDDRYATPRLMVPANMLTAATARAIITNLDIDMSNSSFALRKSILTQMMTQTYNNTKKNRVAPAGPHFGC